jgi:zinc protease
MTVAVEGLVPTRVVLDNGTTVLAQGSALHPAVTLLVALEAGSAYDPMGRDGVAHFVSRVIDRGSASRTADALSHALDFRGVSFSIGAGRHTFTLSCTCLTEDLDEILELVAEALAAPTFPPHEVETRRGEIVTGIRQDDDNPAVVAGEQLQALLYPPGHPYGRFCRGTVASIENIRRADLAAFHSAWFAPGRQTVVVVGDIDAHAAIEAVDRAVGGGGHPAGPKRMPPASPPAPRRRESFVNVPGKPQADIAYGFLSVPRNDPDYLPLVAMNNVLGQYGLGGRLGDSIRERQGMAYYAYSGIDANVGAGTLVVRAGVAPENVARAIASIDAEIMRIVEDGITPQELTDTKQYLVGSIPRMLETNVEIASFLQTAEFFDLGLDYDRRLPGLIESVTLEQVQAATCRVLDVDRATIVVAGSKPDAVTPS